MAVVTKRRVGFMVAAVLVACAAIGSAVYDLASPNRSRVGGLPADLAGRDVEFESHGATLCGWFVPFEQRRGVIVLLHGVRGNRLQMVGRPRFLHRAGYSALLYDSRAHGESGGDAITFHVRTLKMPKLSIFGTEDRDTTVAESTEVYNRAAEPKEMWAVEGAGHVDLCRYAGREYEVRVLEFLDLHL
jgi:pimeloyl-ACP methyl ester carboxylesterase